ncbi:restriction endonuclease subunit S [Campylobacter upsaliensis]|uniref:restriction endonuclease subunit S n=1 Tax=Campylobacter upsaliensis TaxID=28080 RepID=UPI00214A3CA5|nr:restriction endonuclease subunit S [Campylobacter upsaliensis]MCR2117233.1 restriction endonuclease subunit S [Campylobacter upsaliensis]
MRVYKPSGIKWLGEIPHHWEVRRLKYLVKRIIGGGTPDTSNLQYWANDENEGYLWVSIEDITNADFITDTKRYINQSGLANSSAKLLPPFSILYSIYASLGKIAYSNKTLATNQAILGIQPNELLFYKFLFYYLQNTTNHIISFSNTTTQNNISLFIVANHKIPLPPLQEQKEIAEFLDEKCEKIQNYINKKQKLITLLQEKKQALINEVVTKGLNPNIESKNSGIAYLGLIPHHWEAVKVKFTAYVKGRIGFHGLNSNEFRYDEGAYLVTGNDFDNNEVMWDKCRRVSEERFYEDPNIHLQNNDLLITKDGTIGKTAIVNNCPKQATLNSGIFLVRTMKKMCFVKYLFFIINSQYFKEFVNVKTSGSTIKHLYQSDFHDLKIPLPPLQEQKQIANFLDEKCEKINSAIEKTKRQIELIKEYKNTLINEAVCGRINFLEGILNE